MTPITLDDHRYLNGTAPVGPQPYLLHAQWHEISATAKGSGLESMALIVVYRYDMYYVPWSVNAPTSETLQDNATFVTADPRPANGTEASTPTSTPSTLNDSDHGGDKDSSSKLVWTPWPYGPVRRITTSGSGASVSTAGIVSNGVADYLYESEAKQNI